MGKSMDWFLYDNGLRHERVNGSSYSKARFSGILETINPFHATGLFLYPCQNIKKQEIPLSFQGV